MGVYTMSHPLDGKKLSDLGPRYILSDSVVARLREVETSMTEEQWREFRVLLTSPGLNGAIRTILTLFMKQLTPEQNQKIADIGLELMFG